MDLHGNMMNQNESFQFSLRSKMKTFRCDSLDATVHTELRLDFFRSSEGGSGSNSSHKRQAPGQFEFDLSAFVR